MQRLVVENLRLADKCARKWTRYDRRIDYDDYFQTACVGLLRAAKQWDANGTARFGSYAYPFMDGAVKRMRSIHYTGHRDGLGALGIKPPTWVQIDHSYDTEDDQADRMLGSYEHDLELRESIMRMELREALQPEVESSKQRELVSYITSVRNRMKDLGLSITALAKLIGVTQPTLSRWLSNDTRLTSERQEIINNTLKEFSTHN